MNLKFPYEHKAAISASVVSVLVLNRPGLSVWTLTSNSKESANEKSVKRNLGMKES